MTYFQLSKCYPELLPPSITTIRSHTYIIMIWSILISHHLIQPHHHCKVKDREIIFLHIFKHNITNHEPSMFLLPGDDPSSGQRLPRGEPYFFCYNTCNPTTTQKHYSIAFNICAWRRREQLAIIPYYKISRIGPPK